MQVQHGPVLPPLTYDSLLGRFVNLHYCASHERGIFEPPLLAEAPFQRRDACDLKRVTLVFGRLIMATLRCWEIDVVPAGLCLLLLIVLERFQQ
jgi:hypothetical protein